MNIGSISNNYTIPVSNISKVTPVNTDNTIGSSQKVKPVECETCKNRKYADVSNEGDVSFKTPGTIRPEESFAKVRAHEQEHVTNATEKGNKPGAQLVSASVQLKMGVCPECGRTFVAGGVTTTQIKYSKKSPYDQNRKAFESEALKGNNIDVQT